MSTTYIQASKEVHTQAEKLIEKHHPDLLRSKVKLRIFDCTAEAGEDGTPKTPPVSKDGYPVTARAKINSYRERCEGKPDATIYLDKHAWDEMSEDQHDALLDQMLHYLEAKIDTETSEPLKDELGRPKLKMRHADHRFSWFNIIAQRHGMASQEVSQARAFADKHGQIFFGFATPPEGAVESKQMSKAGRKAVTEGVAAMKMAQA